jgi:hypothetical protein
MQLLYLHLQTKHLFVFSHNLLFKLLQVSILLVQIFIELIIAQFCLWE